MAIGSAPEEGPTFADVEFVTAVESDDGTWKFDVTVRHEDTGWEHYADAWEVLSPDGTVLATRVLTHPHVNEQPFTRSMSGITIPEGVTEVRVRAHDLVDGYGGKEINISLDRPSGAGFEVSRVTGATGQLTAEPVDSPPEIDGVIESVWERAEPVMVPLNRGGQSGEHALDVGLRALYDRDNLYLLAEWPEAEPGPADGDVNKLNIHWQDIPGFVHCSVACHTAFIGPDREVTTVNAVTIPQGAHDTLPGAGAWYDGGWVVEWSRPLQSDNLYDLQLTDLSATYPFRVKVFEGQAGQPDPVTEVVHLGFRAFGGQ